MRLVLALLLLSPIAARAGEDDQVGMPPPTPAAAHGGMSPAGMPPPPTTAPAIDPARIDDLVDRAVERSLARRLGPAAAGPTGWAPPSATPQAPEVSRPAVRREIVAAAPARRIGYLPVVREEQQYAEVLVEPSCCRRAAAALGARLVELGRPRTRTMRIAPASVRCTIEEAPPARPVYPAPQSD
jgi:hypothetical protein